MNNRKRKTSEDFKTLVSVHEAGHAVVFALLNQTAPFEIKVNLTTYQGGYMLPPIDNEAQTKKGVLDNICILMAGRAVEEFVFGKDNVTTGAASDIRKATELACLYVRHHGFHDIIGYVEDMPNEITRSITELDETNPAIKNLLHAEYKRAMQLIDANQEFVKHITNLLIEKGIVSQKEFMVEAADYVELQDAKVTFSFVDRWMNFNKVMVLHTA